MSSRIAAAALVPFVLAAAAAAQSSVPTIFVGHYTSNAGGGGSVSSIALNPDGSMSLLDNEPTGEWTQSLSLSPNGRFIACANGTSNDVVEELRILEVGADGSLTVVRTTTTPDSPLDMEWIDDEHLAVLETDFSTSMVHVYAFDDEDVTLTLIDSEVVGGFSGAMAVDRARGVVFVERSLAGNAIRRFVVEPGGTLTPAGMVFTPAYALGINVSPDGSRVYGCGGISSGGHAVVGYYTGDEAPFVDIPGNPFFSSGSSPSGIVFSEDGLWAFVGHGTDATVRTFAVNPDGSLSETGFFFDVGLQGSIGEIAVLGGTLIITDDTSAIDGIYGVYAFGINADGSFTQLGPIFVPPAIRPEGGIAVWTPPAPPCPGDFNGDGVRDTADFFEFFAGFFASPPDADYNGDGATNTSDFFEFFADFFGPPCA